MGKRQSMIGSVDPPADVGHAVKRVNYATAVNHDKIGRKKT